MGVGHGANDPVPEKHYVTETTMTVILETNLVEEESSHAELMKCTGESPIEASVPTTLLTTKTKTRIGTRNIRTLYATGETAQVCREMPRYQLKILGLCETRLTGHLVATGGELCYYPSQAKI